ncbi:MAG TPA: hypothetical protein VFV99_03405 [Kofleriaceae bacterium]|nr:hypothetical protein [Kofleriaceae bacterium]
MRSLAILLLITSTASASPYDIGWATLGLGLGPAPDLSGDLADRLETEPCESTCPVGVRMAIGGGLGRWGVDLQIQAAAVEDTMATDYRDHDRNLFRAGPIMRYTLVRSYGVDLSVRGGLQIGSLIGESSTETMPDPKCPISREGMCAPIKTTYDPEGYTIFSMPLGATLRLGTRVDGGGFMGLFADFDYSIAHVSFPDDGRWGTLRSMTFGFTFGSMFDLR